LEGVVDVSRSDDVATSRCPEVEAWAEQRRRMEFGPHWIGPDGPRSKWRTKAFSMALGVFARSVRFAGLYGRGRRNALRPELVAFDLPFHSLPASFDGYRILHISDTHLDALPKLGAVAAELLAGVEVDLIALTGDVMAAHDAKPTSAVEPLERLLCNVVVRDCRLAVLGNHDAVPVAEALREIGFQVLINQSLSLERNDERIVLTGLDDVHCFYTEAAHAALFKGDAADFRIALVHSPEMADHAATAGVSLYLCGHTHGGQICLPNGRWLLTRLTRCRHAARGLWWEGPMTGYTSRGLGVSAPTLRFNCPGEMTLITLRRVVGCCEASPGHR
jgi:predicted MPP superfamily phosphohydrolase